MKNTILFWLFVFAIVYITNSCGARKSDVTKKEETTKTDFSGFFRNSGNFQEFLNYDFNLTKWSATNVNDNKNVETEEMTVEPSDITKPASYTDPNGKKYILDNAKLTKKNISDKTKTNSQNSQNSQEILKTEQEKRAEQKTEMAAILKAEAEKLEHQKQIDRQAWSLWNLLWLLVPVTLFLSGRWLWKRYKKRNPLS